MNASNLDHVLTAKQWTVSSRERKPTVGDLAKHSTTLQGVVQAAVRPFQGRMSLDISHSRVSPTATQGAPLPGGKPVQAPFTYFAAYPSSGLPDARASFL